MKWQRYTHFIEVEQKAWFEGGKGRLLSGSKTHELNPKYLNPAVRWG